MRIWVDTPTGTWGCIEDLMVLELDEDQISELDELSDVQRSAFAIEHGQPV